MDVNDAVKELEVQTKFFSNVVMDTWIVLYCNNKKVGCYKQLDMAVNAYNML